LYFQSERFVGLTVLAVTATDADFGSNGSITYSLKNVSMRNNQPLFTIDAHSGLVSTMQNDALDREIDPEYQMVVVAKDRGFPSMSC